MMFRIAVGVAMVLRATAAWSQPSFDCARASTPVERTICGNAELAKADRDMAAVYQALAGKLFGVAKDHLLKGQIAWLDNRAKACTGDTEDVARCLRYRYDARLATLKAEGEGPYPFVSEQTLLQAGKVKAVRYQIDAAYPRFDGAADFSAVNRAFAAAAQEGAKTPFLTRMPPTGRACGPTSRASRFIGRVRTACRWRRRSTPSPAARMARAGCGPRWSTCAPGAAFRRPACSFRRRRGSARSPKSPAPISSGSSSSGRASTTRSSPPSSPS
jgi:uncharacterized protein